MGSAGGHAQRTEHPNRLTCISACRPKPHTSPSARKSFLMNVTELRPPVLGWERSSECRFPSQAFTPVSNGEEVNTV